AHGVKLVAVFGREPDSNVELTVCLEEGRRRGTAQRGLHEGVDVADIEPVAGGFFAIDLDVQIGLSEYRKNSEVGNAPDLSHLAHDLISDPFQHAQVAPDDLDRVGSLNAGKLLLDIVLDVL